MPNPPRPTLAELFDGVAAAAGVAELRFGARAILEHDAPPRVTIVPAAGTYEDPVQRSATQPTFQKAWAGFEAHLWAASLDDARELERKFLEALRLRFPGDRVLRVAGSAWVDTSAVTFEGEVVVVRFAVGEPLVASPPGTVVITACTFTGAASGDGRLHAGET